MYIKIIIFLLLTAHLLPTGLFAASLTTARQHQANARAARQLERFADSTYFFNEAIAAAREANSQTFELECIEELISLTFEHRKVAEAEEVLRRLLELQTKMQFSSQDLSKTRLLLGYSVLEQGRLNDAETLLKEATKEAAKLPSQRAYIRTLLGLVHHRRDEKEKAEYQLRKGANGFLKDDPPIIEGLPCPIASLGAFYHVTKRPARAEKALRRALKHSKERTPEGSCRSNAELARLLLETKRDAEAIPFLVTAINKAGKSNKYIEFELVCDLLFRFGKDDRASAFLEERMNFFERTTNLMGMRRVALLYRAFAKYQKADNAFKRLMKVVYKHDPQLKSYLGLIVAEEYSIVLWHLGRQDEAKKLVGQVPALRHKTDENEDE